MSSYDLVINELKSNFEKTGETTEKSEDTQSSVIHTITSPTVTMETNNSPVTTPAEPVVDSKRKRAYKDLNETNIQITVIVMFNRTAVCRKTLIKFVSLSPI